MMREVGGTRPLDCVFSLLLPKPDCFLLRFRRGVSVYCRVRDEVLLLPASRYPAPAVDLVVRHKDKDSWHRGVKIAPPSAATSPEASSPAKVTPSRPGAGVCVSWNTVTGTITGSSTSHGTKARRSCSVSARHLPFSKGTGHALEHAMKPIGFRSETSTTVIGTFATKELFVE